MAEESDKPVMILPGPVKSESISVGGPERRRTPRYPFTAAAEVSELRTQTRMTGRSSDLGLDGCYVDTISPFAVGTVVRVRLESEARKFEAMAKVTYSHESMGMGMEFTEIKPGYLPMLHTWIAELSGGASPASDAAAEQVERGAPGIANLRLALNELINMLVRKQLISEVEGARLLRQIFQ